MFSGEFIDKNNQIHNIGACDVSGRCYKKWTWLSWRSEQYYYIVGFRLFLARKLYSVPYEMISLCDSRLVVIEYFNAIYLILDKLDLRLEIPYGDWREIKNTIRALSEIFPPSLSPSRSPYKYLCVNFIVDWMTVIDLKRLDCAVCNKLQRSELFALYNEFGSLISKRLFPSIHFHSEFVHLFFRWAVPRNMHFCNLYCDVKYQSLRIVLESKCYNFSGLLKISFHYDAEILYELTRLCPILMSLDISQVKDWQRLGYSVIVHNRQLQWLNTSNFPEDISILTRLSMHHRNLPIMMSRPCPLKAFRTALWYQVEPRTISLLHRTKDEIEEVCLRTATIERVNGASKYDLDGLVHLLTFQVYLTRLNLAVNSQRIINAIASCTNVTHLDMYSSLLEEIPHLDWSRFASSRIRLRTMRIDLKTNDILRYCVDVLSTVSTLAVYCNDELTDEHMHAIIAANLGHLTSLTLGSTPKLTDQTMTSLGSLCSNLKVLYLGENWNGNDVAEYLKWESKTLVSLELVGRMSLGVLLSFKSRLPSLRYLTLNKQWIVYFELEAVLLELGSHLLTLGLTNCDTQYRYSLYTLAGSIANCCTLVYHSSLIEFHEN